MFYIEKQFELSAAHRLSRTYPRKCPRLHGHNWHITVCCKSPALDENGMVADFSLIKQIVQEKFDHQCLNDFMQVNPTAENIAYWICKNVPNCYRVVVQESDGNTAIYEEDN